MHVFALALLLFGGCASHHARPASWQDLDGGYSLEKRVLTSLTQVDASPDQRRQVLAIFDELDPRMQDTTARQDRLRAEWRSFDATADDYAARAGAVARALAAAETEQLNLEIEFNRATALALGPELWPHWQRALRRPAPGQRSPARGRDDYPPSGRGR